MRLDCTIQVKIHQYKIWHFKLIIQHVYSLAKRVVTHKGETFIVYVVNLGVLMGRHTKVIRSQIAKLDLTLGDVGMP